MPAKRITTIEEVGALARRLLDATRVWPVVAVTTRHRSLEPLVAADQLAGDVAPAAVYVLETGELTWELTALLPDGLSVHGGAARLWWPGLTSASSPREHPLVLVGSPEEGRRAARRLREELQRHERDGSRDWLLWQREQGLPAPVPPPVRRRVHPVGAVLDGIVVLATPGGAEVRLHEGGSGWLVRRRRDPELGLGERVVVRVVHDDGEQMALEGAPREPSPRAAVPRPRAAAAPRPSPVLLAVRPSAPPHPAALAASASQTESANLSLRLVEAQHERRAAEARAAELEAELTRALKATRRLAQQQRRELRSLRDHASFLESQLHGTGRFDDPEHQFRHEVELAWSDAAVGADRAAWPLRDYVLGRFFLSSLTALQGLPRARVVAVCADVVTGRITQQPGRELHPLRVDDGGDSPQLVREDGAKAYRVALQVSTAAARRLHFWRLPDGRVELTQVGVHDDTGIA